MIIVKLVHVKDIIVIIQSQYIVKRMPAIQSKLYLLSVLSLARKLSSKYECRERVCNHDCI